PGVLRFGLELGKLMPLRSAKLARLVPLDHMSAEKELHAIDDLRRAGARGDVIDETAAIVVDLVTHFGSAEVNAGLGVVAVVRAGTPAVAVRVDLLAVDEAIDLSLELRPPRLDPSADLIGRGF